MRMEFSGMGLVPCKRGSIAPSTVLRTQREGFCSEQKGDPHQKATMLSS